MIVNAKYRYETPSGTVLQVMSHKCSPELIRKIKTGAPFEYSSRNEFLGKLPEGDLIRNRVFATEVKEEATSYLITVDLYIGDLGNADDNKDFPYSRKARRA